MDRATSHSAPRANRDGPSAAIVYRVATVNALRLLILLTSIAILALLGTLAWYEHARTGVSAGRALHQMERAVSADATKTLAEAESLIDRLVDVINGRSSAELRVDSFRLYMQTARLTLNLPQVLHASIWDETGHVIVTSQVYPAALDRSIAERSYFRQHRDTGVTRLINEPMKGRLTGDPLFIVSRALVTKGDHFAGVVTVRLMPNYFEESYRNIVDDEPGFAISLIRGDGTIIAGYPGPREGRRYPQDGPLMQAIAAGETDGMQRNAAGFDRQDRYVVFRKLISHPLYVVVSRTHEAAFTEWRHDVAMYCLLILPGGLVVITLLWLALTHARAERAALVQWHDEEAKRLSVEGQLRQLQKFEALGELIGGLTHDLNNILNIIHLNLYTAKRESKDDSLRKYHAAIDKAVSTGQSLTRHLLAFSRRSDLNLQRVDLAEVVPAMCELAQHALPSDIIVERIVSEEVWPVDVDCAELQLAVINMIVNARDAMPDGGLITLTLRNVPHDQPEVEEVGLPRADYVALSVRDTGTGIQDHILERIFEPFFTTKLEGKGTGLGLSRVWGYARQLGGLVTARNDAAGGAVFTMYIPKAVERRDVAHRERVLDG